MGFSPVRPYPTNDGCPSFGATHKLHKCNFLLNSNPPTILNKQKDLQKCRSFIWRKRWDSRLCDLPTKQYTVLFLPTAYANKFASSIFEPHRAIKKECKSTPFLLAEAVGFEPTIRCRIPDFESGPL